MDEEVKSAVFANGSLKVCSLLNTKEYCDVINQHNIKLSKFMRPSVVSIQPIILQDVEREQTLSLVAESIEDISCPLETSRTCLAVMVPDIKFCSCCKVGFADQSEQRQHYKLDWHRYNIRLNSKKKQLINEQQFNELMDKYDNNYEDINEGENVSSISGSDSEESCLSESDVDGVYQFPASKKTSMVKTSSDSFPYNAYGNNTKVIFENSDGNLFVVYKCILVSGEQTAEEDNSRAMESRYMNQFNKLAITLPNSKSLVIMMGGGHFAAAIFKGSEPILHKTFHCYTVRSKQGGMQSAKDNKRATGPKSAGASLRRYNEQAMVQHVQDILSTWADEIAECKYIFYRAVGQYNRCVLFSGKQPPLSKSDPRLCKVPFITRRATYSEVQKVHTKLMSLFIYESEAAYLRKFQVKCSPSKTILTSKKKKESPTSMADNVLRASKLRQSPTRDDQTDAEILDIANRLRMHSSFSSSDNEDIGPSFADSTLADDGLKEYYNTPVQKKNQKHNNNQKNNKRSSSSSPQTDEKNSLNISKNGDIKNKSDDDSAALRSKKKSKNRNKKTEKLCFKEDRNPAAWNLEKSIYKGCVDGDLDFIKTAVEEYRNVNRRENSPDENLTKVEDEEEDKAFDEESMKMAFNQWNDGLTLLHIAAKYSQKEIVRYLLENGSNPCTKDKSSMTAYDHAPDKDTRNVFRRFMGEFPHRYDYSKSHIPSPLTDEIEKEMADKKRALRKAKKQKEKERWLADEPKRKEDAEKKRFLELSDREKRALAAERRILAASDKSSSNNLVLVRCYQCAINITGQTPFEFNNKVFCTMDCLKANRMSTTNKL